MRHDKLYRRKYLRRDGASAVELALTLPFMLIFLLGMIDAGQFVNVWNKVDNASREGARLAVRSTTSSDTEVVEAVNNYMTEAFHGVASERIGSGVSTEVRNAGGAVVTDLSTVPAGDPIFVEVTINYDAVRWLKNNWIFSGREISTTTQMRRE